MESLAGCIGMPYWFGFCETTHTATSANERLNRSTRFRCGLSIVRRWQKDRKNRGMHQNPFRTFFVLVGLSECKSQSARNALSKEQDTVEFCESYDRVMRTFGPQFGLF